MVKKVLIIVQLVVILVLAGYFIYQKPEEKSFARSSVALLEEKEKQFNHIQPPQKFLTFDVPEDLNLAGERVPLDDMEVLQRLDRELHVNTYWNSNTIFLMKRSSQWFPHMAKILEENGIPNDFQYLPLIESGLLNVKSPAGALGFWQFMEHTARELGLEVNDEVDERYDPIRSTEAACKYLKQAFNKFGNWTNVVASYNMGMAGMHRSMMEQKVDSYYDLLLNDETSRYVFRLLAIKEIMENPGKYGYDIPEKHLYKQEPLKEIKIDTSIPDLVDFALNQGINYKILKQYNPWLRKKSLTIKQKGKSYTLLLPQHSFNLKELAKSSRNSNSLN
ncbi:lytic transglycosylase domain-containing protein [soil metagenome]